MFYVLAGLGKRLGQPGGKKGVGESGIVITGDIGCYTLGTFPPLNAMDTTACMGASIGQAMGMEKAGLGRKVVAVIGDSTFLHSGVTALMDAVYNGGTFTLVILDNGTTAMTGHQDHPGTGVSAQGLQATKVDLEGVVRGVGVSDVRVVDAFNIRELRRAVRAALASEELSVIIARGGCAVITPRTGTARTVDTGRCDGCDVCLLLGCPAIQKKGGQVSIEAALCAGAGCTVCQQVCPRKAIVALPEV